MVFKATAGGNYIPPLERSISISARSISINEALNRIATLGHFSFSYSPKAFNGDEKVYLNYNSKPVRYILDRIFFGKVIYRTKGEYVILLANARMTQKSGKPVSRLLISGYVLDSVSHSRVKDVTIYDARTLTSTLTDEYGHFSLAVNSRAVAADLLVRKEGYINDSFHVSKAHFQSVEIALRPYEKISLANIPGKNQATDIRAINEAVKQDSNKVKGLGFLLNSSIWKNRRNITDKIFRKAQFSLLPTIGTNRLVGGNVVNDYSLNLLAGYNEGVNKLEVSAFANLDRKDVKYFQAAGFANIVGGKMTGCQLAGFINIDNDTVVGLQGAGFMNASMQETKGMQAAGFANSTRSIQGVQAAGAFNIALKDAEGLQAAGLFNYAGNMKRGVQLAPFNFADSCKGLPIGLFSYVNHGYHKIELSADEMLFGNIAFRSGVKKFHNILTAGVQTNNASGKPFWTLGYGLGTTYGLGRKLDMDWDLTINYLTKDTLGDGNGFVKLYTGIDWHLGKKISIALGPEIGAYVKNSRPDNADPFDDLKLTYFSSYRFDNTYSLKTWIGGRLAIRFL
jgi:hypothetical protein